MRISSFPGLKRWRKSRGLKSTNSSSNSKRFKDSLAAEQWLDLLEHPASRRWEEVLSQTLAEVSNLPKPEELGPDWATDWLRRQAKAEVINEIFEKYAILTESAKKLLAD